MVMVVPAGSGRMSPTGGKPCRQSFQSSDSCVCLARGVVRTAQSRCSFPSHFVMVAEGFKRHDQHISVLLGGWNQTAA